MSGSVISWAICKFAPRSRQITTPAPHHSVFYRPDALSATQPTVSKHWRHKIVATRHVYWSLNIACVCMMYVCQCWFAHSLRKFAVHDWSIEQKWMTLLLPLLLLYNSKTVNDLTLGEFWEQLFTTRRYVLCSMSVTSWSQWQNRSSWFLSQRLTWKGIGYL